MLQITVRTFLRLVGLSVSRLFVNSEGDDTSRLLAIDQKLQDGEFENVIVEATSYVRDYPQSFQGYLLLGWANVRIDKLDHAAECFDKALAIEPKADNAFVGKGVVYNRKGDLANARKSYHAAIKLVPDNPQAFSSLVVIELMEGNDSKAVEYGKRAWALQNDDPSIAANLAIAYHYAGDIPRRDEYCAHAKRLRYRNLSGLQDIFNGKISLRKR